MQPDPRRDAITGAQAAQFARKVGHMRTHLTSLPRTRFMPCIHPISGCVLRNDQQLFGASGNKLLRLTQHSVNPAACKLSTQGRNNAERAAMVAAFGNFQIAVMARRKLQSAFRYKINERTARRRCRFMDRRYDSLILMRARNRQNIGKAGADDIGFVAHAARHDDTAIFRDSLTNGFQAFFLCRIEKTARIDEHDIGTGIIGRQAIAVCTQFGENPFAIDQRLGATKRYHADLGRCFNYCCHDEGPHSGFRCACHGQ